MAEKSCQNENEMDTDERDEDDDRDMDRMQRFVDSGEKPEMFKSKSLNELKPFYNGSLLDERMSEIRKAIYYIRQNWCKFDKFRANLKQLLLQEGELKLDDKEAMNDAEVLLSSYRTWLSQDEAKVQDLTYEAIKLYTSKEGHAHIYRVSNNIFRQENISVKAIRSVVFLVELINIDLFNYCQKCPDQANFKGLVYRGMCITDEDMKAFKSLRQEPISRRNICVPLGLFSASSCPKQACKFIKHQKPDDKHLKPLILQIHVIGLKPEYIDIYTSCFPTSVLTTICAVDIHMLSRFRKEKEVLLRGPFFLILDMFVDDKILGEPCDVVEAVMLNANRDHISTSLLGHLDTQARDIFAAMVTITRSEFAVGYCNKKGLFEDENEYQEILNNSKMKLDELLKQVGFSFSTAVI